MGYMGALAFAQSGATLEQALSWHLSANHYPPHPACMVPVAKRALQAAQRGKDLAHVLPAGITFRGRRHIRTGEAIAAFHLDAFLDAGENE